MENNLIDEYWLFVNPIILGEGIPLFTRLATRTSLILITSKAFACGVVLLHYKIAR
jgi:dihydrofolate reductase